MNKAKSFLIVIVFVLGISYSPRDPLFLVAAPYLYDSLGNQMEGLVRKGKAYLQNLALDRRLTMREQTDQVRGYFRDSRAVPKAEIEGILAGQITEEILRQGLGMTITNRWSMVLPPLSFDFRKPPNLLIVSPRERIEVSRTFLLDSHLSQSKIEEIEKEAEKTGVSVLIEGIGGLGAFWPFQVLDGMSLSDALQSIAHEWTHQYLFLFYPLGRAYGSDQEMRTVNETVADIVGKEIGLGLYRRYYGDIEAAPAPGPRKGEFDFAKEMRAIRLTVDDLLRRGEVSNAEAFMEERRQYLISNGYYVRRLNQAYLAFHSSYADNPAFANPMGEGLKTLRERSPSLAAFVRDVGNIGSKSDLENLLNLSRSSLATP